MREQGRQRKKEGKEEEKGRGEERKGERKAREKGRKEEIKHSFCLWKVIHILYGLTWTRQTVQMKENTTYCCFSG